MSGIKGSVPVGETIPYGMRTETMLSNEYNKQPEITNYITIFDYDDTLLPSSWISHLLQMRVPMNEEIRMQLEAVDRSASSLLREAKKYSTVLIITNAESGWVEESARLFMPCFYSLLDNVKVVSARSLFESSYPCCSTLWKEQAFKDEIDSICSFSDYPSILSVGDSLHEREAVFSYGRKNNRCLVKSIKLIEVPSPSHLATQQDLISSQLQSMILSRDKLDLKLSVQASA